jgi:hypothetical protein
MTYNGKKPASNLCPGDVIPPPSHERKWLWRDGVKRMMRVIGVRNGRPDKKGPWLYVEASYSSPYGPDESSSVFRMRPDSIVIVQAP